MLQIIGWLLCLYLVVKGFELLAMKREEGTGPRALAQIGAAIAWIGALVFFFLVNEQANSTDNLRSGLGGLSATLQDPGVAPDDLEAVAENVADELERQADAQ